MQVPFGKQQATISIPTPVVLTAQMVDVTATLGHTTQTATVTVNPPLTLSLSSGSVTGGTSVAGTIALFAYPAGASSVTLKSSDATAQIQPAFIAMSPNQTVATFTVTTTPVTTSKTVSISASSSLFSGVTQTAALTVSPPAAAQLQSLTIAPQVVTGGSTASGTIALTAPAPITGVAVTLKTSNVEQAQLVQQFVEIPSGQTTASFTITTSPVSSVQAVTITATAGGVSESAVLTIQ